MAGLYLEEFEVDHVFKHATTRTVTEADNVLATVMSMNPQPLHLDHEFAAQTEFKRPLVNSMFTLALVIGLSVQETTLGTTIGNLGMKDVNFPKPVFAGDTIRVETTVVSKRVSQSRPDAGIVEFEHRGINQRNEIVCICRRFAFMKRATTSQSASLAARGRIKRGSHFMEPKAPQTCGGEAPTASPLRPLLGPHDGAARS